MSSLQEECRGRVQAQGDDIHKEGGYSYSWTKHIPVTNTEGLLFLSKIKEDYSTDQQKERNMAFVKAQRFVENASKNGGVRPEAQPSSFRDRKSSVHNARVDIEIISGLNFIPEAKVI